MLTPEHVGDLLIDPHEHPREQPHLSAASGLVQVKNRLYVVSDDEHHLGIFAAPTDADTDADADADAGADTQLMPRGELFRIFEGDLPLGKKQRKLAKPDLETLTVLAPLPGCPFGALLAFGSGSLPSRETGVLIALDAAGGLSGRVAHVDLGALYAPLREQFADLNIEGAFYASGELRLLQRGNKGDARSACISFDWNQMAPWLAGQQRLPTKQKSVQIIVLGDIGGVPLSLTDGTALAHGAWAFCAVAENTADSFSDGPCAGSAVGVVAPDGTVRVMHGLSGNPKVEGISAQAIGEKLVLILVTDADDPAIASKLLRVRL